MGCHLATVGSLVGSEMQTPLGDCLATTISAELQSAWNTLNRGLTERSLWASCRGLVLLHLTRCMLRDFSDMGLWAVAGTLAVLCAGPAASDFARRAATEIEAADRPEWVSLPAWTELLCMPKDSWPAAYRLCGQGTV